MKKIILTCLAALLCGTSYAQKPYPVQGLYKLNAIEAIGKRYSDLPERTYRACFGDKTLLVWVLPDQGLNPFTNLSWRVEFTPNPDDPYCIKVKENDPETCTISWYNTYQNFYDFPQRIWIDEIWKKVSDDNYAKRISAVATGHAKKDKLLGTWTQVAIQVHEQMGDSLIAFKGIHKIYGEKECMMFNTSLYNIEAGGQALLRPFQWVSDNEFIEAGVKHKVTFISPTKMTLEYQNEQNGRITETWIRYDIPEPLATLLSNFK